MDVRHRRLLALLPAALAIAGGIAFRLHHLFVEPLWLDEAYTAYAADRSLAFLWRVVPGYETHPPFYYTLMHLWGLVAGQSLVARRLPALIAGLALLILAGVAGRRVAPGRRDAGWTAAAAVMLLALSPMAIEMARQVRPYAFMGLACGAGLLAVLEAGRRRRAGLAAGWGPTAAVLAAELLLAWLHNLGALHALSLGLALLVQLAPRTRGEWARWTGGHALVLVGWAPALAILADQAPTWIGSTWLRFQWATFPDMLGVLYATPALLPLLAALAGFGALRLVRAGRGGDAAALALLALLPVALALAVTLAVAPVFLTRTLSPVVLPALLLAAVGTRPPGVARWLGAGVLAALLLGFVQQDAAWRARGAMQHWDVAVTWLADRIRPGDAIWAYPNEGGIPFDYAARDRGLPFRARPIPMAVPARGVGVYPTGSRGAVTLRAPEVARFAADRQARTAPTLWLLRLGPNAYDRGDAMLHALERGGRRTVSGFKAGPISLIGLRRTDLPPPDYLARRR